MYHETLIHHLTVIYSFNALQLNVEIFETKVYCNIFRAQRIRKYIYYCDKSNNGIKSHVTTAVK